jgi:HK97 gp10 family phage protein
MGGIKITGLDKLQKALKDNVTMDDVKRVVRHHGAELQQNMQDKADFKMGYQKGDTKRSISLDFKEGGMTAVVGPETDYSPYVEHGTRFMEAQPFVKPAFDEQKGKFKSDMQKLMK